LDFHARISVTTVTLCRELIDEVHNLPNLRKLIVQLALGDTMPDILCDPQLSPKVTYVTSSFYFSSTTKNSFENFIEVNGHRITILYMRLMENASQLVKILSKATNLRQSEIIFISECKDHFTRKDAEALYRISVRNGSLVIVANSVRRQNLLRQTFQECIKKRYKTRSVSSCRSTNIKEEQKPIY